MMSQNVIILLILAVILVALLVRRFSRSLVLALGAVALVAVYPRWEATSQVWGTVFLGTASLMFLAGSVRRSGIPAWLAIKVAKACRGRPKPLLWWVSVLAFAFGAALGPVAAVTLVLPVSLLLATELQLSSVPFALAAASSGLWGSTLFQTSGPGPLWMAQVLHLGPLEWAKAMAPWSVLGALVAILIITIVFWKSLRATNERRARLLEFEEARSLASPFSVGSLAAIFVLLIVGLAVLPPLYWNPALFLAAAALLALLAEGTQTLRTAWADLDGPALVGWTAWAFVASGVPIQDLLHQLPSSGTNPSILIPGATFLAALWEPGAVAATLSPLTTGSWWVFLILGTTLGGGLSLWPIRSNQLSKSLLPASERHHFTGRLLLIGLLCLLITGLIAIFSMGFLGIR